MGPVFILFSYESTHLLWFVIFFPLMGHFFIGLVMAKIERKPLLPLVMIIAITRRGMRSILAMTKPITIAQTVFFLFTHHISW